MWRVISIVPAIDSIFHLSTLPTWTLNSIQLHFWLSEGFFQFNSTQFKSRIPHWTPKAKLYVAVFVVVNFLLLWSVLPLIWRNVWLKTLVWRRPSVSGGTEEHDPLSAFCFVTMTVGKLKQVCDGLFNYNPTTKSKLQWIVEGACLLIQMSQ